MLTAKQALEKGAKKITATINNSAEKIIVEFSSGQEFPIEKAYFVNGRQPAIKLLVDYEGEENSLREKIEELEGEIENYQSEIQDAKDDKDDAQEELEKWTDNFGDDSNATKTLWDNIEEEIREFAQTAEINLVHNDANNISNLREEYENKVQLLSEADEIIGELKLENISLTREINNLKNKLAIIEKEAKVQVSTK